MTNTKLGDPYERCATNVTADAQHFYRNKTYTLEVLYASKSRSISLTCSPSYLQTCLATCYQKYILKSCGCGDPRYPLPSGSLHCNLTKSNPLPFTDTIFKGKGFWWFQSPASTRQLKSRWTQSLCQPAIASLHVGKCVTLVREAAPNVVLSCHFSF